MKFKIKTIELTSTAIDTDAEYTILEGELVYSDKPQHEPSIELTKDQWKNYGELHGYDKPQKIEEIPQDAIQKVRDYSSDTTMTVLKVLGIMIDKLNELIRAHNNK